MDCSPPGSSVQGISQARTMEWVAFPSLGIFLTQGSNLGLLHCRWILFTSCATKEAFIFQASHISNFSSKHWVCLSISIHMLCAVLSHFSHVQLCVTPMDCSPPGSSVHGILQARGLEWVAMSSSRGFSRPRDWTWVSCVSSLVGRLFTTSAAWKLFHPCEQYVLRTFDIKHCARCWA